MYGLVIIGQWLGLRDQGFWFRVMVSRLPPYTILNLWCEAIMEAQFICTEPGHPTSSHPGFTRVQVYRSQVTQAFLSSDSFT